MRVSCRSHSNSLDSHCIVVHGFSGIKVIMLEVRLDDFHKVVLNFGLPGLDLFFTLAFFFEQCNNFLKIDWYL